LAFCLTFAKSEEVSFLEQTAAVHRWQTDEIKYLRGNRRMRRIPSIDRIRELKEEIAALAKLNALYKATSHRCEVTVKANVCRGLRLLEIREELGAMKRPDE
jgi:hypothetical protein